MGRKPAQNERNDGPNPTAAGRLVAVSVEVLDFLEGRTWHFRIPEQRGLCPGLTLIHVVYGTVS